MINFLTILALCIAVGLQILLLLGMIGVTFMSTEPINKPALNKDNKESLDD